MTKKWYVLHTYSGYENKVKKNLENRIEAMGLENNVFAIEIPTESVTEIKDGGRRVETEKKVFPGYVLVRMDLMTVAGLQYETLKVLLVLLGVKVVLLRLLVKSTTKL